MIKRRCKIINVRQERQRSSTERRHAIINKACTNSGKNQTLKGIKRRMVVKGGRNDGLSETKDKHDSTKEVSEEEGDKQVYRWHGKSSRIGRWNCERGVIKEKEQGVQKQKKYAANGNERRDKVARDQDNDESKLQTQRDKVTGREGKESMTTRRRVRIEEDVATMERRTREKKGKSMAKEESAEEIFVIQEDSEEDVEMYDSDREAGDQFRGAFGKGVKYKTEEQQEQHESGERQVRG